MSRASCMGLCLLAVSASACRDAPLAARDEPAPIASIGAAPLAALPAPDPRLARLPLQERLAMEASSRPALAVHPEQLRTALTERGVSITRKRQVMASALGASYCELSVSSEGLGVSLCEYPDAARASAGRDFSQQRFDALVSGRTLLTQGNTLLTVTHPESPAAEQQLALILSVFASQKPSALQTETASAR